MTFNTPTLVYQRKTKEGELVYQEMKEQERMHYTRTSYHRFNFDRIAAVVWKGIQKSFCFPETYSRTVYPIEGIEITIEEDAYGWHRKKIGEWSSEWEQGK